MGLFKRFGDSVRAFTGGVTAVTDQEVVEERGYPYSSPSPSMGPVGSLFATSITNQNIIDIIKRYQLGRRIVEDPIEDAVTNGFEPVTTGGESISDETKAQCLAQFFRYKTRLMRHWKLTRAFGCSAMVYGYGDTKNPSDWATRVPEGTQFSYCQPIPKPQINQIKTTEELPLEIEWINFGFGNKTYVADPSRFLWCINPAIVEESKEGESVFSTIYDMLEVQKHSDWSIGQQLWRNAGGLLSLYAPKRTLTASEKQEALASVYNHHAKTVVYVPNGWMLKETLRKAGSVAIARTYDVIIKQISAGSGIPPSVLLGQQKSNIFSKDGTISEDQSTYFRFLAKNQENMLTPQLKAFWRTCQIAGTINPGELDVRWNTPQMLSPLEKKRRDAQSKALDEVISRLEKNPASFNNTDLLKLIV